jgi:hypothetical protein
MDSKQDWDHKLIVALWACRTTYKISTHTTPFLLAFGVKAILLMEFEVPSLKNAIDEQFDNSQ